MVDRVQMTGEATQDAAKEEAQRKASSTSENGTESGKILGKFNSYEDLEKSYTELEKKLSQGGDTNTTQDDDELPSDRGKQKPSDESEGNSEEDTQDNSNDENDGDSDEDKARDVVEDAGLDFDALRASYEENDGLTDEDYDQLASKGIPKELVDEFIEGQEARRTLLENQVFETVGGQEAYSAMTEWARENWDDEQLDIFNSEVNSGNTKRIMFAVEGLKAQFERSTGFEPSRMVGGRSAGSAQTAYQSWAEVQADMSDPRYANDPAFRAKVEAKLDRSKL